MKRPPQNRVSRPPSTLYVGRGVANFERRNAPIRRRLCASFIARYFGLVACCAVLLGATLPGTAMAVSPQEKRALELTSAAKQAFTAAKYEQAAMLFKQAYAQVPEPTLLFNSARSYQKGKFLREALSMFRLYLTLATYNDAETRAGRTEAVQHIAVIDKQLQLQAEERARKEREAARRAAQAKPPQTTPPAATPPAATPPAATPPAATPPSAMPPATKPPAVTPPATTPRPRTPPASTVPGPSVVKASTTRKPVRRPGLFSRVNQGGWTEREIAAMSLMGGGGAVLLTGVILHAVASSTLSTLEDDLAKGRTVRSGVTFYSGVSQRSAQDAIDSHNGLRLGGNMLVGLGAVAISVGGWLWLNRSLDGDNKLSLAPSFGSDGFGWSLQGRF